MKRLAVTLAIAVALTGCGDPAPETGYVRDRDHRDAYTTTWIQMVCAGYDSKGHCTVQMPIEQRDHHPERWRLLLEECSDDGECRTGWRSVSEDQYEAHPIGTHYPDPR